MENQIAKLKPLIPNPNNTVLIWDILIPKTQETIACLTNERFLKIKEYPEKKNFMDIISDYEKYIDELLKMLVLLNKFDKGSYFEDVTDIILNKLINSPKNNEDGYGYIWRHFSYYPLMIIFYTLGILFMKQKKYSLLYKLMNKTISDRLILSYNIVNDKFFERLTVFNLFSGHQLQLYNLFIDNNQEGDTSRRLFANTHVYNFIHPFLLDYFDSLEDFDAHFDLFEYFLGIVTMNERLKTPNDIKFGPYGRRYWKYSESGRTNLELNNLVKHFVNDSFNKINDVLKVGFFEEKAKNLQEAYNEYVSLLRRIYR